MRNKPLDENIKDYYAGKQLSSKMEERLLAMNEVEHHHSSLFGVVKSIQARPLFAIAASLLLIVMLSVQFLGSVSPDQLMKNVVKEVVLNHQKNLAIEFVGYDYDQLAKVMDKLDFTIKAPDSIKDENYTLLGSRYCSIQGHIAAQMKMANKQGKVMTLYVTRLHDNLQVLQHQQQLQQQVWVDTWYEGELFYSLAISSK